MLWMIRMDLKRLWRGKRLRRVLCMEGILILGFFLMSIQNARYICAGDWEMPLIQHYIASDPVVFFGNLFSYLFPVLVSMPFATAFYDDVRSGYLGQLAVRQSRVQLLVSRYISVSLSGMFVAIVGPIASLLLEAGVYPAVNPSPVSSLSAISDTNFLSSIYYENWLLYVVIMTAVSALIGGLLACISMTVGLFAKGQNQILFLPMLIYLFWHVLCTRYYVGYLSPLAMLDVGQNFPLRGDVIAVFLVVGNLIAFSLFMLVAGKRDILKDR